jgi:hypothetical protein
MLNLSLNETFHSQRNRRNMTIALRVMASAL